MATLTIDRGREGTEEDMSLATVPVEDLTAVGYAEPVSPIGAEADMVVAPPVPTRKAGLLTRMGRSIVSFYDQVSGPPMSRRERIQCEITEAQRERWRRDF